MRRSTVIGFGFLALVACSDSVRGPGSNGGSVSTAELHAGAASNTDAGVDAPGGDRPGGW